MTGCQELDIWLAAHLGDVFDKLALTPDDEERSAINITVRVGLMIQIRNVVT